jgi:ADP-ribosyl-[dinitrogen reductase] hydrolase
MKTETSQPPAQRNDFADAKSYQLHLAYLGSLAADALAMPVHWYYDRVALRRDYGQVDHFLAPKNPHPDSILWRSTYQASSPETDILRDQAQYWGQRGIHYHQFLRAGENTLNFQLARELHRFISQRASYHAEDWLNHYIQCLLTPGWHRDTYFEEYHRAFFHNLGLHKKPLQCGIKDEHIGGLAPVAALLAASPKLDLTEACALVQEHVALTHRHRLVLATADVLVRLLYHLATAPADLEKALVAEAPEFFSLTKAQAWAKQPDEVIVGQVMSPACYIADAFPAALYLAWKYRDQPRQGIIANAMVGGDNCHRGAVVGSLLGAVAHEEIRFEKSDPHV